MKRSADNSEREAALFEASKLKVEVKDLEAKLDAAEQQCLQLALLLPNDTHPNSPLGPESSAVTLSTHGPEPLPSNPKRDHVAISEHFGLLDLKSGSTVTGTSWYFLRNEAALLELALTNYSMSIAIQHGFTPVTTPDVVRYDIAVRCGFQPRDDADPPVSHMYQISPTHSSSPELVLAGTAEIPLAGIFANKVYSSLDLPLKYVGVGHAFRSEAGARSADTRGLYRVHQFTKVELFTVTAAGASEAMMEDMLSLQKSILEGLNIPFKFSSPSLYMSITYEIYSGFLTCLPKNWEQVPSANTTLRPGCLDVEHGGRYLLCRIVQTSNRAGYIFGIVPKAALQTQRPRVFLLPIH